MYGQPNSINDTPLRGNGKEILLRFSIDNFLARNKKWKAEIKVISNGVTSILGSVEKIKCLSKDIKYRIFSDLFANLSALKFQKLESLKIAISTLEERLKRQKNNKCPFNCQETIAEEQIDIERRLERVQKEFITIKQLVVREKEKHNE